MPVHHLAAIFNVYVASRTPLCGFTVTKLERALVPFRTETVNDLPVRDTAATVTATPVEATLTDSVLRAGVYTRSTSRGSSNAITRPLTVVAVLAALVTDVAWLVSSFGSGKSRAGVGAASAACMSRIP